MPVAAADDAPVTFNASDVPLTKTPNAAVIPLSAALTHASVTVAGHADDELGAVLALMTLSVTVALGVDELAQALRATTARPVDDAVAK